MPLLFGDTVNVEVVVGLVEIEVFLISNEDVVIVGFVLSDIRYFGWNLSLTLRLLFLFLL